MTHPNYIEAAKALAKALDAIENAQYNLKGEFTLATANRSYYACYYCMTALLYTKGIYAKTHPGVHAKFSEIFIKSGILPVKISSYISILFAYRQEADYDLDSSITIDEATEIVEKAIEFREICQDYYQELLNS